MERLATQKLIEWNDSFNRKPLIVWGARQVGKTYLVKDIFAESYYKDNYIYIDFKIEDEIREFCYQTANPEKIIEFISLQKEREISDKTLVIFDEVQECPNIISSLKYFCQDYKQIPIIATGSMVRIKIQREVKKEQKNNENKFLFPVGKINQLTIYPLSFEEFLLNNNKLLYEKLKKSYYAKQAVDESIHQLGLDYIYKYMLIGGMPEAVNTYLKTKNLLQTKKVLVDLYDNYLSDMELYQVSRESIIRTRLLFSNIYKELNKEAKNFSPSLLKENSKTRDFLNAINWLSLAHIINCSYQIKEHVSMPLIQEDDNNFRLYLSDIGMFSYQSGINATSFISKDRENTLSGIFFENFVANELVNKGINLFYWKGKNSAELEFIVESNNKIYPLDVKKGRGILNSLEKFSNHNKYEYAIKISSNHYGYDENKKILTIPFYYCSFLADDLANGKLK